MISEFITEIEKLRTDSERNERECRELKKENGSLKRELKKANEQLDFIFGKFLNKELFYEMYALEEVERLIEKNPSQEMFKEVRQQMIDNMEKDGTTHEKIVKMPI